MRILINLIAGFLLLLFTVLLPSTAFVQSPIEEEHATKAPVERHCGDGPCLEHNLWAPAKEDRLPKVRICAYPPAGWPRLGLLLPQHSPSAQHRPPDYC